MNLAEVAFRGAQVPMAQCAARAWRPACRHLADFWYRQLTRLLNVSERSAHKMDKECSDVIFYVHLSYIVRTAACSAARGRVGAYPALSTHMHGRHDIPAIRSAADRQQHAKTACARARCTCTAASHAPAFAAAAPAASRPPAARSTAASCRLAPRRCARRSRRRSCRRCRWCSAGARPRWSCASAWS
jgi:hypothetical protein